MTFRFFAAKPWSRKMMKNQSFAYGCISLALLAVAMYFAYVLYLQFFTK